VSIYYVVGEADTRGEFYPKGVTKSLAKAEKYKAELASQMYEYTRQWIQIKEVNGI
jgi:hypothetical protein